MAVALLLRPKGVPTRNRSRCSELAGAWCANSEALKATFFKVHDGGSRRRNGWNWHLPTTSDWPQCHGHDGSKVFDEAICHSLRIRPLTAAIRPFFAQVAFGGWSQLSKRSAKAVSVRPGQPHRAKHHNHPHLRASLARIVLLEEGVRGGLLKGVLHGFAY